MSNEHVDNEIPERGGLPIRDRDVAIIELWDALSEEDRENPVLDKYRRFVNEVRGLYGL
jgi:hypothetical protein